MKRKFLIGLILVLLIFTGCTGNSSVPNPQTGISSNPLTSLSQNLKLPAPRLKSDVSLEESLLNRRSIREYTQDPLNLEEVSQLLWSAQGVTSSNGGRTAPSAGALYPLEVYLVAGKVENLASGVYRYQPQGHELIFLKGNDVREDLASAALGQSSIKNAAIDIIISAVYERTTQKYGERGIRYAQIETGHVAQNIGLQAAALDLGAVTIGAFEDNRVKSLINLPENESPLYIIAVGKRN